MSFRVLGLSGAGFAPLYGLSAEVLAARGVRRMVVSEAVGFPDRVEMRDCAVGEAVLLLNYMHQPAGTAYQASHAIFVREGAMVAYDAVDEVPEVMRRRVISLRGFDAADEMSDAALAEGGGLDTAVRAMLGRADVSNIHAHFAMRGCYAARIERA